MVGAAAARDDVVARPAEDPIGARTSQQRVVAAEPEDRVVEAAAGQVLAATRADDAATATVRRGCGDRLAGVWLLHKLSRGNGCGHGGEQRVAAVRLLLG